jgi:Leucine-rich repeat (LRR) protein
LSSNQLEGSIPYFLLQAGGLYLSKNKFSDIASFLCSKNKPQTLVLLDLSDNQLTGELPDCWNNLTSLQFVDLSNNNLSGNVPFSMAALVNMKALILRNNSLSGKLTSSLIGRDKLALLDLGENKFYGPLPSWTGDNLHRLVVLSLRFNNFYGSLPSNLCNLRELQVLDLSLNSLSGGFLACVKNFTSMTQDTMSLTTSTGHLYKINFSNGGFYFDSYDFDLYLMWKGVDQRYKNVDMFLKTIDLSSNHRIS